MKIGKKMRLIPLIIFCVFHIGINNAFAGEVTIYSPCQAHNGYTLFSSQTGQSVKFIDMWGNDILTMEIPNSVPTGIGGNPKPLLSSGNILILGKKEVETGPKHLIEANQNMETQFRFAHPDYSLLHHDQLKTKEGNYFALGHKKHNVASIKPGLLLDDYIIEIDPDGNVIWEWLTSDHFESLGFSDSAKDLIWEYDPSDVFHSNSIQILPENTHYDQGDDRFKPGNILVSQRNTSIVFIIDKESGEIVWKTDPDDNVSIKQHHATMIRKGLPGAGNILIFDNGGESPFSQQEARPWSRVIEVNADKEIVWNYTDEGGFYSAVQGSAQRLPNGNTLISATAESRIFEVNRQGEIVWEVQNQRSYRAYRVPYDFID